MECYIPSKCVKFSVTPFKRSLNSADLDSSVREQSEQTVERIDVLPQLELERAFFR
jgi:hypothetical protein